METLSSPTGSDTPGGVAASTDTPHAKRSPSGAAIPGAHPRPKKYPHQLIVMVSDATWERIEADARAHAMSKSEVGRTYLEAGIELGDSEVLP